MSLASGSASAQTPLVNGGTVAGSISPAGDTDLFTFSAAAGENIQLRVVDLTGSLLDPQIEVTNPSGGFVASNWGGDVGSLSILAPLTGTYTLRVSDGGFGSTQNTGSYEVQYARMPGANEHGALVNAGTVSGAITLGDLDTFVFNVIAGENIGMRGVDTTGSLLDPSITVYDANGAFVGSNWGGDVAFLNFVPLISGTYTLLVSDGGFGSTPNIGNYEIHYARMPGANEHGALVNAGTVSGAITLGDLDTFVFNVIAGENIVMRGVDTTGSLLDPAITVYDANGAFVGSNWGGDVAFLNFVPLISGTYTLLVSDGGFGSTPNIGNYEVHYARKPGANENGLLVNGGTVTGSITLGDLDTFVFDAMPGESRFFLPGKILFLIEFKSPRL